jgi:two-component system, OmpR family, phosphate regulon sensor histidine kinase PhoR
VSVANTAARRLLAARLAAGTRLPAGRGFDLHEIAAKAFVAREVIEVEVTDREKAYRIAGIPPEGVDDVAVLVVTDHTEHDRRERVERDFVAYASHELRTPLATISGAIEILQGGAKEIPDARDRFLRHIEREVSRLGRLVAALLVLARVQAGHELPEVGAVRVHPVLAEAAARLSVPPAVDIVVACPADLAVVAHRDLLVEIMGNLGGNAAKYTETGTIVFAALAEGDAVAIEVRDTGRGIPVEAQDMLFERFFRADDRKSDGFGLGLAIVREAVTALGGGVEIESVPGSGTTVRVVLPLAVENGFVT